MRKGTSKKAQEQHAYLGNCYAIIFCSFLFERFLNSSKISVSSISISFCILTLSLFSLYNLAFPTVLVGTIILLLIKPSQILYKVVLPIPAFLAISDIEKSMSLSVNK